MSAHPDTRIMPAPPPLLPERGLPRWVCTSNPFYALSAALFLAGLWLSFGGQSGEVQTWALMSGLAGYTLLLAVTACLLVRLGNVWDDVRTVLLLVVLMFLATSVTFDELLVLRPARGVAFYLVGLLNAIALSEGLLRGIRLRLPARFRLSYHLLLALFFLYPLALSPLLSQPRSEALLWGLFGFSAAGGLALLTLVPAARLGPDYVRANGSPWPWPLYPWVLFGLLGAAVPARAFLLCWSLHLLDGGDRDSLVFGPYFLVPFGLCVAALLLEVGLGAGRRAAQHVALAVPAGLVALALLGHRPDPIYQQFLATFSARLGGDPLALTLVGCAAFYAYAALRRVRPATEALTATLAALAVAGLDGLSREEVGLPWAAPLLAAAAVQLGLGLRGRDPWRCLAGGGIAAGAALSLPGGAAVSFHLAVLAVLAVGAAFDTPLARRLRVAGTTLAVAACFVATFGSFGLPGGVPGWALAAYPLAVAAFLAGYAALLRHRPAVVAAALALGCWASAAGWRGYLGLREAVAGLDHLLVSLALFGVAVLVSLYKAGALGRWLGPRQAGPAPPAPAPAGPPAEQVQVSVLTPPAPLG